MHRRFYFVRSHAEELYVQAASDGDLERLNHLRSELGNMRAGGSALYSARAICYEALQFAAQNGHATIVKKLLVDFGTTRPSAFGHFQEEKFSSHFARPWWYFCGAQMTSSPIHLAVKEGHVQVVQEFIVFFQRKRIFHELQSERKLKVAREWFQGLVEWAVRWGHALILNLLLTHEPFFVPLDNLCLPVHLAAHHNHRHALEVLLQYKYVCQPALPFSIDVPLLSKDGLTALHLAAQSGSSTAVALLLNTAEMDVNVRSCPELFTPLHMAANSGHVEVVNFLLESLSPDFAREPGKKVDLMARDCMGRTALHYAAREGHEDVVRQLLKCSKWNMGNIASIADHDGLLALHMAARAGHVGVIRILKSQMSGSSHVNKARQSLSMKMIVEREYMVRKDAESVNMYYGEKEWYPRPKLIDSFFWKTEGFTPLHFAARYGHDTAVRELLKEASADLHVKDHEGLLAYDWMEVQEKGQAFLKCVKEEVCRGSHDYVEGLKQASFCMRKMTNARKLKLVSEIQEEKKAMKELLRAWERGTHPQITMPIVRWLEDKDIGSIRIFWLQWAADKYDMDLLKRLLAVFAEFQATDEEESLDCVDIHYEAVQKALHRSALFMDSSDVVRELFLHMPEIRLENAFQALEEAVENQCFESAKEILLQAPGIVRTGMGSAYVVAKMVKDRIQFKEVGAAEQSLEDFLVVLVTREGLEGGSNLMRWMLPWAKQRGLRRLLEVMLDLPELKKGVYEDRQVYLDCASAILVGAALIGGVAFQGWLQPPLGYNYAYDGQEYADVQHQAVRTFWRFNNGAFFLAVGALIAAAKGAVPVARQTDIVGSVEKVKRAVAVASSLLGMALLCVIVAFIAAGFAVLPPLSSDVHMMRVSIGWGSTICSLALLWFASGVLPLVNQLISPVLRKIRLQCAKFSSKGPPHVTAMTGLAPLYT